MAGFWAGFSQGLEEIAQRKQQKDLQKSQIDEQRRAQQAEFDFRREERIADQDFQLKKLGVASALETVAARRSASAKQQAEYEANIGVASSLFPPHVVAALASQDRLEDTLARFKEEDRTPETVAAITANVENWVNTVGAKSGADLIAIAADRGIEEATNYFAALLANPQLDIGPMVIAPSGDVGSIRERQDIATEILAGAVGAKTITTPDGVYISDTYGQDTGKLNAAKIEIARLIANRQGTIGFYPAVQEVEGQIEDILIKYGIQPNRRNVTGASRTPESQEIINQTVTPTWGDVINQSYTGD